MSKSTQKTLSLQTAQTLAVIKQGLHQRPSKTDRATMLQTIRQIGLLQLDSVSVVARSHYLVMLSRLGLYDVAELDALLYPDRRLFEQWAHAACLIPTEDYSYFAPGILARRGKTWPWERPERFGGDPQGVMDMVLQEIRERGPLTSKDFADPRPKRGSWWDHKPAKHALDYLYSRGYLMIDRRVNFQIHYDLAERVLPASAEAPTKTEADFNRWATRRSIRCLGVATARQISDYYRQKISKVRTMLETLTTEEAVIPVSVEGWKAPAYLDPADLSLIATIEQGKQQPTLTTFLSPFDNLTWNRDRLSDLFSFNYKIELYTPVAKRKYGYYVLPILHRGRFVGRLDPKVDRKTGTLIIHAIYLEPSVSITENLIDGIVSAIQEFMAFHACPHLTLTRSEPAELRHKILEKLAA